MVNCTLTFHNIKIWYDLLVMGSMERSIQNENGPNAAEAAILIQAMLQETMVQGSVDSEPERFRNILADLNSGAIAPFVAIAQARSIAASRQDYH